MRRSTLAIRQARPCRRHGCGGAGKRPHVTIRGLSKRFDKTVIYDKFDLDIPRGELISVFGPNGCGKSTLINMIAGLIPLDAGEILFDGMQLSRDQVRLRLPELSRGAVSLAARLRQHRLSAEDDEGAAGRAHARAPKSWSSISASRSISIMYPYQMSGGQQQLVSIMRALVVEPEILFLDEPFSALDYEMTLFMREQLQKLFMETGTTTVLVSHDLEEAVYLADRVLLLSRHPARVADFTLVDGAAAAHRRDAVGHRIRPHQGALPGSVPARGAAGMNSKQLRPVPADHRRRRSAGDLVAGDHGRNGSIRCCCRRRSPPSRRSGRAWTAATRLRFRQDSLPHR